MKVLLLLPGTPIAADIVPAHEQVTGLDLLGNQHCFARAELVNNLLTLEGLRHALGEESVLVRHVVGRQSPISWWRQAQALRRLCKRQHIELVHQFWGGPAAAVIALWSPVPYVLSLLGSDLLGDYDAGGRHNRRGRWLAGGSRLASLLASGVVVMSEQMKAKLPKAAQAKTIVACEGLRPTDFHPMDRQNCLEELGWPAGRHLIFFDSERPVKNRELAAQAIGLLQQQAALQPLHVHWVQQVPHARLPLYYNAADVLLLTSRHEGSNNSLKEALACGCPVVSTDAGDARRWLAYDGAGVLVESANASDLAAAASRVLLASQRAYLPAMALQQMDNRYIGGQLAAFYKAVVHSIGK
ncbi:MAG: glycosyltransferase [Chitinophagaceae bacterium]|nr:glycosyltransferase [Chitinophagaceae bacterium]